MKKDGYEACPFCGDVNPLMYVPNEYASPRRIGCSKCFARGPLALSGGHEAVKLWNRRFPPIPAATQSLEYTGEADRAVVEGLGKWLEYHGHDLIAINGIPGGHVYKFNDGSSIVVIVQPDDDYFVLE